MEYKTIKPELNMPEISYMFKPMEIYRKPESQIRIEEHQQQIKQELQQQGIYWPSVVPEYKI
jgi:hypothetical protein